MVAVGIGDPARRRPPVRATAQRPEGPCAGVEAAEEGAEPGDPVAVGRHAGLGRVEPERDRREPDPLVEEPCRRVGADPATLRAVGEDRRVVDRHGTHRR